MSKLLPGHTGAGTATSAKKGPALQSAPQFHPYSVLRAMWKQKLPAVAIWIAITALTVAVVLRLPRTYQAEATVLVRNASMSKDIVATTVSTDMQDRLERIRQRVLSHDFLMQLMERYKLHEGDRKSMPPERIVEYMRDEIDMKVDRGWGPGEPNTFKVAVMGKDAEATMKVANYLAQFFVDENRRQRELQASTASDFFNRRMGEAKTQVEANEARLNEFKSTYAGELPQQQEALLATLSQARTQLQGVQDALSRSAQNQLLLNNTLELARSAETSSRRMIEQAAASRKRMPATAVATAFTPGITESQRLEGELTTLRQRYGERHPDVRRAKARYEEAKARDAAEPGPRDDSPKAAEPVDDLVAGVAFDAADRDLRLSLTQQHERAETLKAQIQIAQQDDVKLASERIRVLADIADIEGRIRNLPLREQQMATVLRDYEMGKSNYQSMVDKKLTADVSRELEENKDAETFQILDHARTPQEPVKPKRSLLAMGGSVFGLLIALIAAVALEMRKQVMLGEWELPPGTPVLGRVIELPVGPSTAQYQLPAARRQRKRA